MTNGNMGDFPQLGEQDCKAHNLIAMGHNARLKAMEKTLYDDKVGLTRIVPVLLSQGRLILSLLAGILLAIISIGIGYLFKGGA